jgi:creatinine amidohydrolase
MDAEKKVPEKLMRPWVLEELNFYNVRQEPRPCEVAVLPMGATEPHNYHLPYGNDFLTTRRVAERICETAYRRGAKVLLLPTIPFGVDSNLLKFPLTIHVSLKSLEHLLRDVIRSLECHGIHKLVLLNGHGGNELKPLLREWYGQTKVFVTVVDWWKVGADKYAEIFSKPDDHAGEMETSIALALYPELVDLDKSSDGATRRLRFEAMRRGWAAITRPWHLLTESSGVGDPRAATRENGERYLEIVTERLAQFLVELSAAEMDGVFPFE